MPPASSPLTDRDHDAPPSAHPAGPPPAAGADVLAANAPALTADVRAADRTQALALLFAPEPARFALIALAAYRLELARITLNAGEALAAEVRLQWWRDAIRGEGYGNVAGVPLVDALRAGATRYLWPVDTLTAVSEAHIHDLYADPFESADAFDGYAGEVEGALIQLGAMALAVDALGEADGLAAARTAATAAGYAGVLLTAARAITTLEGDLARARTLVPAALWPGGASALRAALEAGRAPVEAVEAARTALAAHGDTALEALAPLIPTIAPCARPAFVRALAAAPVLRQAARRPRTVRAPGPLTAQWRLWRAAQRLNRA